MSCTVTVNVCVVLLLCALVALQVTVVTPNGNVEPLAGRQCTTTGPFTASVAVGVTYDATAPSHDVASTTWFAGATKLGELTVNVNGVP